MQRACLVTTTKVGGCLALAVAAVGLLPGCLSDITLSDHRGGFYQSGGGDPDSTPIATTSSPDGLTDLGPAKHLDDAPPPVSGGTLAIAPDGKTIVAADPDRDLVYLIDAATFGTPRTVQLSQHDEPGRTAIDPISRFAYVALRRGGAVVAIDLKTAEIASRTSVCPAPRGIAWDAHANVLRVVCMGGEIVTLVNGVVTKSTRIPDLTDLRDVMVARDGTVHISTFRDAQLVHLSADESSVSTSTSASAIRLPLLPGYGKIRRIAWKTLIATSPPVEGEDDTGAEKVAMVSQSDGDTPVETPPQYYNTEGSGRSGARSVVTVNGADVTLDTAVVPVDIAISSVARQFAVASVGNTHMPTGAQIVVGVESKYSQGYYVQLNLRVPGEVTAVAYLPNGQLLAQSREPARLFVIEPERMAIAKQVELSAISRDDTGHTIFHTNSGAGMACASCHPEGRDDGHSWKSLELGARRTPSLIGTVKSTAPYHWNGEAADMKELAKLTFTNRMQGPTLRDDQMTTLDQWLTALPAPPASIPTDAAAVTRGQALFTGTAKCATCHQGASFTSNLNVNVSTGGAFQVPSLLGVAHRAPYLHDGSAPTLMTVLSGKHTGTVVSSADADALIAYLNTL